MSQYRTPGRDCSLENVLRPGDYYCDRELGRN